MKTLITLLMIIQVPAFAQPKIKKLLVEGQGIPIVMLAGGTGDMSALDFHSKELSKTYKLIRMEHFNVQYASEGLSLPENYSTRMESEAIKHTLDSMGIREPIVMIGHSYGGLIALDFALHYPDRIRLLVLIEPPVFGIVEAKNESIDGMKKMQELLKELTPRAEITETHMDRFRCALLNCDSISVRKLPQWTTWVQQKNRLRGLSAVAGYKVDLKRIQQFKKPVLIITGARTVFFHKRINTLLAKEFPSAKEIMLESGHAIPATTPQELVRALLEFINR